MWLKNPYNLALVGVIVLAIAIRLYFFFMTKSQPLWWDEADYLSTGKTIAGYDLNFTISPRRTFLLPLLFAGILKLGLGELTARFMMVLFSLGGVYLTYLVGKEMYGKKTGLIASFAMSVFYLHLFFTARFLTSLPATTLLIASIYFFWKDYVKKPNTKGMLLAGAFFGLAVFMRAATLMMAIPLFIVILLKERHKFLLNKKLWIFAFATLIMLSPFIIWIFTNYENPIQKFTGIGEGRWDSGGEDIPIWGNSPEFIKFFPTYLQTPWIYVFIIGIIIFIANIILGLDLLLKKDKKLIRDLFILLWIIIPIFVYGYLTRKSYMEPRYLMYIFPAVFTVLGEATLKISKYIKKYQKHLGVIFIILILASGAYYQLNHSNSLIKSKKDSYTEVKQAALWVKERSDPEDIIFTASWPQTQYYAERKVAGFSKNLDQYTTMQQIHDEVSQSNPKYFIASIFQPFPQLAYQYPDQVKDYLVPVQAYQQAGQTVLVIYEVQTQQEPKSLYEKGLEVLREMNLTD